MLLTASTITLTLALASSATPVRHGFTTIPLRKRASLTTAEGVFDHELAVIQTILTKNKHRQNLINLKENKGLKAFNKGVEIKPVTHLSARSLSKRDIISEPLISPDGAVWTGPVMIGTPGDSFNIDFDTGSSDIWVPFVNCASNCDGKQRYNPDASQSSRFQEGEQFSITYADNSTVSGPVYQDTIAVAGVTVAEQLFSPVTTLSNNLQDSPFDGIMGMGLAPISKLDNVTTFIERAFAQGQIDAPMFGFKLASEGSSLDLGGTNPSLFIGDIEYHELSSNDGYWQIGGASIHNGDQTPVTGFDTIIDSGATIIHGPRDEIEQFYGSIPDSELFDPDNGFWTFPCSSIPDISFSWGDKKWSISGDNFNLGMVSDGSPDCVGAIASGDTTLGEKTWLLGASFMKNVYSVFSFETNAVGFATLA